MKNAIMWEIPQTDKYLFEWQIMLKATEMHSNDYSIFFIYFLGIFACKVLFQELVWVYCYELCF